ncbi:MAG TPA: MASE1 domain-containing protein, partial [Miltoncostaeaceae bacterium]|nr:MASE1 domain-containing protein [Miltoncostaeaceae bacterium]
MTPTAPPQTDVNPAVKWVVTRLGDGWTVVAGLALVYLLAARLSLAAMDPAQGIVVLWPISGLGVVSVALVARRRRVTLVGALIAAGLVANLWAGMAWWPSTAVAVANGAESWLGALILTTAARRSGDAVLHGERAALALVGTAILAPAIAGLGAAVAVTSSLDVVFLDVWRSWWIADGLGILLVGILALAIRSRSGGSTETPPMLQWA